MAEAEKADARAQSPANVATKSFIVAVLGVTILPMAKL
jgi:hypothetical protein